MKIEQNRIELVTRFVAQPKKAWKTLTGVGVSGGSAVWSAEGESSTGLALTHHPRDPMEQTAKEKPSKHATPKTVLLQVYQFSHSFIES